MLLLLTTCIYACPFAHDETVAFTVVAGMGVDVWSESHAGRRKRGRPHTTTCQRLQESRASLVRSGLGGRAGVTCGFLTLLLWEIVIYSWLF